MARMETRNVDRKIPDVCEEEGKERIHCRSGELNMIEF
jgi:hypothetical protein